VAEYVERLKDARKRLDLVEASFSLSYELLTPEMQRLWRLLSVFPATLTWPEPRLCGRWNQIPPKEHWESL
jgi:hypothetical protein